MGDDINSENKNQIYFSYREYVNMYYDYEKGFFNNVQNPYTLLLYAKSYFLREKYESCIKLLNKINKDYSTKILYERQCLLFKAMYLYDHKKIDQLENIVKDYQRSRNRVPGKSLTEFHHNSIREMMNFVLCSIQNTKKNKNIDKQELSNKLKIQQKVTKYQGMPSYLISATWNKKVNQFLLRKGDYPGPVCNFQLLNHIFQLEPHQQQGKQYMDMLMFPLTQQQKYYVIGKKHWNLIQEIFGGYPIKRVFINDPKNRQLSGANNIIKTLIQHQNGKLIMQWQAGSFWDKSVIPIMHKKFGIGQLKQQTRNKDFLIVLPGRIQQPYTPLKYVRVDTSVIKIRTDKQLSIKRRIVSSFDLQKYNPDQCQNKNTVGLANLGNTCYMNSGLQFLINLKQLSNYFLTNKYLTALNIGDTNKDGSFGMVTCAFADIVKRMWFSNPQTRFIDPMKFKKIFGERYQNFDGYEQQDAQQFLMFLLDCIHEDLNQKSLLSVHHRQSMGGKTFDSVRNIAVNYYNKHYKSIISQLFHGFHYQQIICDECKSEMYRFQHYLMLHIQAPPESPKITAFVVQATKLTQAKRIDIYTKKLKTIKQAIQIVKKHFLLSDQHQYIALMYFDIQWKILDDDEDINYLYRAKQKNGYFFIYQVVKPQADQQIATISFYVQGKQKFQSDGFPRLLSIKQIYKQPDYLDELTDVVFTTIKKQLIQRDRKQYIKQIKPKKIKGQIYTIQYKIFMNIKIQNFTNVSTDRILGQNQSQQVINLQGCLARMSKQQVIDEWKCQKCNQLRSAHKTDRIYSAGKYIIIQIKRFTENGKITTKIQYPVKDLNMKKYIQEEKQLSFSCIFNLECVILHRGSLNTGHYTSICRNTDRNGWIYHDDQSSREIQEKDVVDSNAYILVYGRADGNSTSRIVLDDSSR